MAKIRDDARLIYENIAEYCETYNIPKENLLDILEDQKVIPMIRGKATEYIGAAVLKKALDPRDWVVEKLNLNPQPGQYDEDVSVTFRRTGHRLKAEMKNAVRGSFRMKTRGSPAPQFKVKCHKSRSNLKRAATTNDRYMLGEFDILLCNVSNSIFRQNPLARGLPIIDDDEAIEWLKRFYAVDTDKELVRKAYDDWRICFPGNIAGDDSSLPRTPAVLMEGDPNWFGLTDLDENLKEFVSGG